MRYRLFSFRRRSVSCRTDLLNWSSISRRYTRCALNRLIFTFAQFDRLLKEGGTFYFKQWKRGVVPFEDVVIHQRDYLYSKTLTRDLSREAPIQSKFFRRTPQKIREVQTDRSANSGTSQPHGREDRTCLKAARMCAPRGARTNGLTSAAAMTTQAEENAKTRSSIIVLARCGMQ